MKVKDVQHGKTTRKSFAPFERFSTCRTCIEVQKNSYQWFLDEGLQEVFHDIGTIEDYTGNLELSFVDFHGRGAEVQHRGVQGARRDVCKPR